MDVLTALLVTGSSDLARCVVQPVHEDFSSVLINWSILLLYESHTKG